MGFKPGPIKPTPPTLICEESNARIEIVKKTECIELNIYDYRGFYITALYVTLADLENMNTNLKQLAD